MSILKRYERQDTPLAPSSFWDTVLLHVYIRDHSKKLFSCYSAGDREGFFDNLTILIHKPISAITAIGNLFVLIRELIPTFKSAISWIPPFAQALSGAGVFLSITQLFLETMGMQRVISFQAQFIHSPPPENSDLAKLKKWASHTKKIATTLQNGFKSLNTQDPAVKEALDDLHEVLNRCEDILNLNDSNAESARTIYAMRLEIAVQKRNLKLLKKYKEMADVSETAKEKLHRRLGIQFVNNLSLGTLDKNIAALNKLAADLNELAQKVGNLKGKELAAGLDPTDYDTLPDAHNSIKEASAINETMQTQLNKRMVAHSLGSIASLLTMAGCAFSILGMPYIGLPLIVLGSCLGMARFLFWITYSESTGWERETDKWLNNQILTAQEIFSDIAGALSSLVTLLPGNQIESEMGIEPIEPLNMPPVPEKLA